MESFAQSVIAFAERNRDWLPLIMVVFAAAETTAFLSLLVPSTPVLIAMGALVATGAVEFLPLWAGATVGALIGSTFSFWLGRRYGGLVLRQWPLRNHPDLVDRTRSAFLRFGPATVLIGHFTTVLRPVVFLLAGISGMTFARFLLWNTLGAVTWAWAIPKLGQFGGDILGWLWSFWA